MASYKGKSIHDKNDKIVNLDNYIKENEEVISNIAKKVKIDIDEYIKENPDMSVKDIKEMMDIMFDDEDF